MKSWMKWGGVSLVIALVAIGALRALSARKAQKDALESQQASQKQQTSVSLAATDLVQVKAITLQQGIAISGSLKAVNSSVVKARVAGELQGLTVREGDFVKAGQIIARVDATEYQARVRQAQHQAESAKAQVDIAKRGFENNRSLVDQGFISKTALESSLATLTAAQATFGAAQAGADVTSKSLDDTVLRAPISGQIAQRLAQPGERVAIDGRVVEIVDLTRMELEASLSPGDSLLVKVGQLAQVRLEGAAKPLAARVVRINPSALAGSRAVQIYLALESGAGLRQGLFAEGTLQTGSLQAMAVPLSAVRTDKPQPYVQLLNQSLVLHQTVELGERGEADGEAMVGITGVPTNGVVIRGTVGTLRAGTLAQQSQSAK